MNKKTQKLDMQNRTTNQITSSLNTKQFIINNYNYYKFLLPCDYNHRSFQYSFYN